MNIEQREQWASKENSSCLQKALPGEPIFVLLAHDPSAAKTVLQWIVDNVHFRSEEKLRDAFECAMAMKGYCVSHSITAPNAQASDTTDAK